MNQADDLLKRLWPGLGTIKLADYVEYVRAQFAGPGWTFDELRILCPHYVCGIEDLPKKVARDKLGKG